MGCFGLQKPIAFRWLEHSQHSHWRDQVMSNIFEDLAWLRRPQADFSRQVAAADSCTELRNLAAYALDENQLIRLAKKLQRADRNRAALRHCLAGRGG